MMKTITLCSSAAFYKSVMDIKKQLEARGFTVYVPATAEKMHAANDFNVENVKTWLADPTHYDHKEALMRGHFDKVAKADSILVVNFTKSGMEGYIGGNTLMEMAVAFHHRKPIFILNPIDDALPTKEEVLGVRPVFLNGDIAAIKN